MRNVYCCGFLFRGQTIESASSVLLVRKTRPSWQAGLLNGIGGKVESGETTEEAMVREAKEEIGGPDTVCGWQHFATEESRDYHVAFFRALLASPKWVPPVRNDVGEILGWVPLPNGLHNGHLIVGNLQWLVPLARDWRRITRPVIEAHDDISRNPSW